MKIAPSLSGTPTMGQTLFAAALSLSAVAPAFAEGAPERPVISYKHLDYQDSQPGYDRIGVRADAASFVLPIGEAWSIDVGYTVDTVSGASPEYHTDPQNMATGIEDKRYVKNLSVTHYLANGSVTAGTVISHESDYISRAFSLAGAYTTEDKLTTFNVGVGVTNDEIDSSNGVATNESKHILDAMFGVTQVLTRKDIVQLNLTHSEGKGYYSDPYKLADDRPREKRQTAALVSWNHHFEDLDGTSRLSYRYYDDTFGVLAHTLSAEWVQPLPGGWTLTPEVRLYSQDAAYFYVDAVPAGTFPWFIFAPPPVVSADQRLSAFGARTLGLKVSKELGPDWTADVKYQYYEQRGDWHWGGNGSPGLEPFRASFWQVGISHAF